MAGKGKIIVALDTGSHSTALSLARELGPHVWGCKVGLELFTACGPTIVTAAQGIVGNVFLDLKLNDIPNTVAGAAREAAKLGVAMFTVHASAGIAAMEAAVANKGPAKVLAVTILTSFNNERGNTNCTRVFGKKVKGRVLDFALDAKHAGVDGIVCSPQELLYLSQFPELSGLLRVIPGTRPKNYPSGDQKRVLTPKEAVDAGANFLVLGRPITNPVGMSSAQAANRIAKDIGAVA